MKGFIFSIEAIFAISLLIIGIVAIIFIPEQEISQNLLDDVIIKGINSIYFNEDVENFEKENNFCVDFIEFDGSIKNKLVCEGYNE
jgi:hypothetical protein